MQKILLYFLLFDYPVCGRVFPFNLPGIHSGAYQKSFLNASFNEGVCATALPANNVAEKERMSESFFIMSTRF